MRSKEQGRNSGKEVEEMACDDLDGDTSWLTKSTVDDLRRMNERRNINL
jgi:hypothetical protein